MREDFFLKTEFLVLEKNVGCSNYKGENLSSKLLVMIFVSNFFSLEKVVGTRVKIW